MSEYDRDMMLEARGIGIRYRHFKQRDGWVLRDINLEVRRGETLGVIGRNGAGKSSMLRVLAGIADADAGMVSRRPDARASLLTINLGFEPHLPIRENVMLFGMLLGLRKREIAARYNDIIEFSGLDVDERQKVGTFSSGMRARLALGIALAAAPDIVLIDELLGVGDGQFREKSAAAIRDLVNAERSVILVTHNLQTLRQLCDRVIWIENGEHRMTGPANEVLDDYAAFLKQMANPS